MSLKYMNSFMSTLARLGTLALKELKTWYGERSLDI